MINSGDIFETNNCGKIKVVKYTNNRKVLIKFLETGYKKIVHAKSIRSKSIKDPFYPHIWSVGFIGKDYSPTNSSDKIPYRKWIDMLQRAYSDKFHSKHPTYKDCTVDERWHNFQNFIPWHRDNYIEGYEIDKDLYIKGNKLYGPETCFYVPKWLNLMVQNGVSDNGLPTGVCKDGGKYVGRYNGGVRKRFDTPGEAKRYYDILRLTNYIHKLRTTTDYIPPKLSRVLINRYEKELECVHINKRCLVLIIS